MLNNREAIVSSLDYDEKVYDATTYRKKMIKNLNRPIKYYLPKTEIIVDDLAEIETTYRIYSESTLDLDDICYYFYKKYLEKPNVYINILYDDVQKAALKTFVQIANSTDKYIQQAENLFYLVPLFSYSDNVVFRAYYLNIQEKNDHERIFLNISIRDCNDKNITSYLSDLYKSVLKNIAKENVHTSIDNCSSDFVSFSKIWRMVEEYIDTAC